MSLEGLWKLLESLLTNGKLCSKQKPLYIHVRTSWENENKKKERDENCWYTKLIKENFVGVNT